MYVRTHDGISLHVQELGSGAPVVMLHGLVAGNIATWYFGVAPLLARTHRVIMFDFRGHGRSERAASGYGVEPLAQDLAAVLAQRVGSTPATLVGHSYGGSVALTFALKQPQSVHKLVLVDSPLPPSRAEEVEEFLAAPRDQYVRDLPSAIRDAVVTGGRRGRRFLTSFSWFLKETSLLEELRHAQDIPDQVLATLEVPLLALYGSNSKCALVGERLERVVPGAKHVRLQGGHNLAFENPRRVAAELQSFLHEPCRTAGAPGFEEHVGGRV